MAAIRDFVRRVCMLSSVVDWERVVVAWRSVVFLRTLLRVFVFLCFLGTICCFSLPLTLWLVESLMLDDLWSDPCYPSGVTVLQGQSISTKWSLELYVLKSSVVDSISTVFFALCPTFLCSAQTFSLHSSFSVIC